MKYLTSILFATVLLVASAAPQTADAACVYRGVYYSDAQCPTRTVTTYAYTNSTNVVSAATIADLERQVQQLLLLLEQLKARQVYYPTQPHNPYNPYYPIYPSGNSDVDVSTEGASRITDDSATLHGEVDFNSSDEATVYFRYGTSINSLDRETAHVVLDDNDDEEFTIRVTNLRRDTDYYFQAVAEDEDGRADYGSVYRFDTDSRNNDDDDDDDNDEDEPEVDTSSAQDITDDSAELRGSVDMNDFDDGRVFFVWGQDEDQIEDVEGDYDTYSDVDEDGDDLMKTLVDSSADGNTSYTADVYGLEDDTDYYFTICVEYEDDDDDDTLTCGDVEDFTTDN